MSTANRITVGTPSQHTVAPAMDTTGPLSRSESEAVHAKRDFVLIGDMGKVEEAVEEVDYESSDEEGTASSRYRRVWVIRHGERADEVRLVWRLRSGFDHVTT